MCRACDGAHKCTLTQEFPGQHVSTNPRGLLAVLAGLLGLLPTTQKLQFPPAKPRLSRPLERLVRKEGNAALLPQGDCFPCFCGGRGRNTAPASSCNRGRGGQIGILHSSRGTNTISHRPGGPTTPGCQSQATCPAFTPHSGLGPQ